MNPKSQISNPQSNGTLTNVRVSAFACDLHPEYLSSKLARKTSENLLNAFAKAKEIGLVTIGLAGGTGGQMKASSAVDFSLVVPSDSIHRVQITRHSAVNG